MNLLRPLATVMLLCVLAAPGLALDLGDKAPKLSIEHWVKGSAIDPTAGGKITVVEFWATWCGPCRTSIPHLTELQKKYKDKVVIVGVSDEKLATVQKYVEKADNMDYVVAVDSSRKSNDAYMKAFKQRGIPHAFIVGAEGKLLWHGHPMRLDEPLAKVVAGTFDIEAAKEESRKQQEMMKKRLAANKAVRDYLALVMSSKNPPEAKSMGATVAKQVAEFPQMGNMLAWELLTNERILEPDFALALQVAKVANEKSGGEDAALLDTYGLALFKNGKIDEAIKVQRKAVKNAGDNKEMRKELEERLEEFEAAKK